MTTAWLFPGQGAQELGMGLDIVEAHAPVRRCLEQASEQVNVDLLDVIAQGPRARHARADLAQPALFALSYGIADVLKSRGWQPSWVAGHSLGEFTAAAQTGALDFESALDLVVQRGRLMHDVNVTANGGMLAVSNLPRAAVDTVLSAAVQSSANASVTGQHIEPQVWIANVNAPKQIVLAGRIADLQALGTPIVAAGGRITWLDVAGPYHSPLFKNAALQFAKMVRCCPLEDGHVPLVANSNGAFLSGAAELREELITHMLGTVDWAGSMARLVAAGCQFAVEVGPGRTMKGLAMRNAPRLVCLTTVSAHDLDETCRRLEALSCALS